MRVAIPAILLTLPLAAAPLGAQGLEETLEQWLLQVAIPDSEPIKLDEEALERLRALGYIK